MATQAQWDEETDSFVEDLDTTLSKKYNISVRGLLMNPDKYLGRKGISDVIKGIKEDSDSYFSELLDGLKDEQTKIVGEMESSTAQYRQVDSLIANKSAVARVPYIKPMLVSRNTDNEETIVIEQYTESFDSFIGKLANGSNYIADLSADYKDYKLGSWLFSGPKNYVVTISPPDSPVLAIENSRSIINDILDDALSRASE